MSPDILRITLYLIVDIFYDFSAYNLRIHNLNYFCVLCNIYKLETFYILISTNLLCFSLQNDVLTIKHPWLFFLVE